MISAPMDFAIVAGWQVCIHCTMAYRSYGAHFFFVALGYHQINFPFPHRR